MIGTARYKLPYKLATKRDFALKIGVPLEALDRFYIKLRESETSLVRTFSKKKKSGKGERIIYDADAGLKAANRKINKMLSSISLPEHFKGGVKHGKIQDNALIHLGNKYVFKLDIKDFFPSVKVEMIRNLLMKIGCMPTVASFITRLITCNGVDPQGYPTAGTIANLYLANNCYEKIQAILGPYIVASYWSDDVTLSSKQPIPQGKKSQVIAIIGAAKLRVHLGKGKTESLGRNKKKVVTGIELGDKTIKPEEKRVALLESTLHKLRTESLRDIALSRYTDNEKRIKSKSPPEEWLVRHIQGQLRHIRDTNIKIYERIMFAYSDCVQKHNLLKGI